jgi:glycosyltransferase involved in cell wall biosynthesis
VDGLVASAVPDVLTPAAERLRTVVLMHMPLGHDAPAARVDEQAVLRAAVAVITTSTWTRRRLLELYPLPAEGIHVATPGVDRAPVVDGSASGTQLLCVAAVTPHKGHDLLAEALARLTDLPWSLECVGPLTRDPDFVDQLRKRTYDYGLADRMRFVGARSRRDVAARYARADLFVLASRGETYGMVVTEALARGIPVVATGGRGLPEAMGRAPDGSLPGILVEPDDPTALAAALRLWLGRTEVRRRLKRAAIARRATLTGWSGTAGTVSNVLDKVSTT